MPAHTPMNTDYFRALIGVIEDQLASSDTPEVKAEYDRLLSLGVTEDDAKAMMADVVEPHIHRLLEAAATFDYPEYLRDLRTLPRRE